MKKSEITEKWQKVLIPARVKMEGCVAVYLPRGCPPEEAMSAPDKETRHYIPVDDWHKKPIA